MNVSYTITGSESAGTQILLVLDGRPHTITESHPSYRQIQERLLDQDFEGIENLINVQRSILDKLSEKVTIQGDVLYYNGEAIYDRLAQTVVEFFREGRSFHNLVNFMERLYLNPSRHSRTQLYEFLNRHNFAITDDGHFLAYKGVNTGFGSITRGPGVVNGAPQNGSLDNTPGNTLEMLRSDVMDDPSVACSYGLHVGTWGYARSFGQRVVEVKVDPADVVSVPNDCDFQKVRTCRYRVTREVVAEVDPNARYDVVAVFMTWLDTIASAYSRKGKVDTSYGDLAERFLEGQETALTDVQVDALLSYTQELDFDHEAGAVYRYHVDAILENYFQDEQDEEEYDEDEYEDGYDGEYDYGDEVLW